MNLFVLFSLHLLTLIPITNGINCVSCVGSINPGCNDPYNEITSGNIPAPGNTYCAKVVYSTHVERMAGGRSCIAGSGAGGSTIYCCSGLDYCNRTTKHISSIIVTIGLMIMTRIIL